MEIVGLCAALAQMLGVYALIGVGVLVLCCRLRWRGNYQPYRKVLVVSRPLFVLAIVVWPVYFIVTIILRVIAKILWWRHWRALRPVLPRATVRRG